MNLIGILNNLLYTMQLPVLLSHIGAGFIALMAALTTGAAAGLIGLKYLKQRHLGKFHLRCWQVQTFATLWVSISSLFLAFAQTPTSYFLFIVGLFTFYMSLSGYLALIKRSRGMLSLLLNIFIIVVGVAMLIFGIVNLQQGNFVEAVSILFGTISVLYGIGDSLRTRHNRHRAENVSVKDNKRFLARSLGAVIAIITAFLLINIELGALQWIVWVTPTIVIAPFITYLRVLCGRLPTIDQGATNMPRPQGQMGTHMQQLFEAVT